VPVGGVGAAGGTVCGVLGDAVMVAIFNHC
jgi:hypothetical protein